MTRKDVKDVYMNGVENTLDVLRFKGLSLPDDLKQYILDGMDSFISAKLDEIGLFEPTNKITDSEGYRFTLIHRN